MNKIVFLNLCRLLLKQRFAISIRKVHSPETPMLAMVPNLANFKTPATLILEFVELITLLWKLLWWRKNACNGDTFDSM
jgi:hypothetical protein